MSKKGSVLREKVIAVTKMMNMYKTLRQEQDAIIKLKQLSPNKKLGRVWMLRYAHLRCNIVNAVKQMGMSGRGPPKRTSPG